MAKSINDYVKSACQAKDCLGELHLLGESYLVCNRCYSTYYVKNNQLRKIPKIENQVKHKKERIKYLWKHQREKPKEFDDGVLYCSNVGFYDATDRKNMKGRIGCSTIRIDDKIPCSKKPSWH